MAWAIFTAIIWGGALQWLSESVYHRNHPRCQNTPARIPLLWNKPGEEEEEEKEEEEVEVELEEEEVVEVEEKEDEPGTSPAELEEEFLEQHISIFHLCFWVV